MPKSNSAATMRDINTILVGQAFSPVVSTKRAGQRGSQHRLKSVPPLAPAWWHRLQPVLNRPGGLSYSSRFFRPLMLRISPAQLAAHLRIEALPEPRQVAGGLNRPLVRRKQMNHQRNFSVTDARRFPHAEK